LAAPFKNLFKVHFTDTTPSSDSDFAVFHKSGGSTDGYRNLTLRLLTTGNVEVRSNDNGTVAATITAPFTDNEWHQVSVWFEESATGDAEIVIDGTSTTITSADFDASTGTANNVRPRFFGPASGTMYITEYVGVIACTNNSDFPDALDVYDYRPGGSPTTAGDAPDAGSWANTGEQPLSESNSMTYNAGSNDGFVTFDSTGGGPAADASTPSGTYTAASYFWWAERGNGGGTTLNWQYGNDSHTTSTINTVSASLGANPGSRS